MEIFIQLPNLSQVSVLFKHASVGNPISVNIVKISTSDLKMTDRQSGKFVNRVRQIFHNETKKTVLDLHQLLMYERKKSLRERKVIIKLL